MSAGILDITVEQGATFSREIDYTDSVGAPIDLTGATLRGQIRPDFYSSDDYPFTLTTIGSPTLGQISWVMSATDTAAIPNDPTSLVYDIEVQFGTGTVVRILQGVVTLSPEVTR